MSRNVEDRFVLGTAQLGMAYGIANRNEGPADAAAILETAVAAGVTMIDTAASYGTAEETIWRYLRDRGVSSLRVISKLRQRSGRYTAAAVVEEVSRMHDCFGDALHGVLLHDHRALADWDRGIGDGLGQAVERGLVKSVGVSVYSPDEFETALAVPSLGIIQAPFNLFDLRLSASGLLAQAAQSGKEVYLRSLFLQGLLLMAPDDIPARLGFARPAIAAFRQICGDHAVSPARAAIGFALHAARDWRLVIGCDSVEQLTANLALFNTAALSDACLADLGALRPGDDRMIDPTRWEMVPN